MRTPLHQLMIQHANSHQPVCHDGNALVSWNTFVARVSSLTQHLKSRSETRWLVFNDNPLNFAVIFFALLHADKCIVIPPNILPGTLIELADAFDAIAIESITPANQSQAGELSALDVHAKSIDLYTSGSTGKPKRVQKTLLQLETELNVLEELWGSEMGACSIISTVPHHHIYGLLFRLLWPLSSRRVFDTVTCHNPEEIAIRHALLGDTVMVSSPAQLSRFFDLSSDSSVSDSPKIIFSSGGPLSATTAQQFHQAFGQAPIEIFGSTETGGIAWRCQSDSDAWTMLPGIHIEAVTLSQPSLAMLSSPFLPDNLATPMDDLIEMLPNHTFRLCGRADKVVKIEQKRLSLTDMEITLSDHLWVASAVGLVISARRESVAIVATLTADGAQTLATLGRNEFIKQLKQHLSQHFEAVLLPRYWRFVETLPVSSTGKVTQQSLHALFKQHASPHDAAQSITVEVSHATT